MVSNENELILKNANHYLNVKKYNDAIRVFHKLIKKNPSIDMKIKAYIGLGESLKYMYELELASKMYEKALIFAKKIKNDELEIQIQKIIENIYVLKKDRGLVAIQIQFFIRTLMSLLSKFGKTDWF